MNLFRSFSALLLLNVSITSSAQIVSDFSTQDTVCLEETIVIQNNSTTAQYYEWDFCADDINQDPTIESGAAIIPELSTSSYGMDLVFDSGLWYGFVTDRANNKIFRYNYGSSVTTTPNSVDDLGNLNGHLSAPEGIDFIKVNSSWYAFIAYGDNGGNMTRWDFGNGLDSVPTDAVDIGNLGLSGRIRELRVVEEGGNFYLVFPYYNGNQFVNVNLTSTITYVPNSEDATITEIAGANLPRGFGLIKKDSDWIAFFANEGNDNFQQIFIGNQITNTPTVQRTLTSVLVNAMRVTITHSGGEYIVVISNLNNQPTILNLHDLGVSSDFEVLSNIGMPNFFGIKVIKNNGKILLAGSVGSRPYLISYEESCSVSYVTSSDFAPSDIVYNVDGSYKIDLNVRNSDDITASSSIGITILNQTAPPISFTTTNQCLSASNTFTPSITGLTYIWNFGDGSPTSDQEAPTHPYLTSGTYTVRLDVSDGTCNNFTEQEITIYPDLPTPTFTTTVTEECNNTPILFSNTTDESSHMGVITYEWDFNAEVDPPITEKSPSYAFTSLGTKQVTLKALIPGCESTSMVLEIEISPGPTSTFSASAICEGEVISFADKSLGNPVSFEWDFGDNITSTIQNPDHLFATAGNFNVSLTVTDALGCEHTGQKEVAVSSVPAVSFDFNVPCTSSGGIQFFDKSTVGGANIVSRTWFVGGVQLLEAQDLQNPFLNFGSDGIVNVRLVIVSSNGCEASHNEDIQVLSTPQPDFSMNIGCFGEPSSFDDLTTSSGNPLGSWFWTLDGATYSTPDINHTFSNTGFFDVTLEVTGKNFCAETITRSVEILELPTMSFSVDGDCSNELIRLEDLSTTAARDSIVSREWSLDGSPVGNGNQLFLEPLPEANYELMLEVTTTTGCVANTSQQLMINTSPSSIFTPSKTFGLPDSEIIFTNESIGALNHQWLLDGELIGTDVNQQTIAFPNPGTYQISLVSGNSLGCTDRTTTEILIIAVPEIDISIGQFEIVRRENTGTIFLEIQNNSNLPIEVIEAVIELQNQFSVTEQILSQVGIGESQLVSLNVGIPLDNSSELNYLCVTLNSQYQEYSDLNPLDNEKCISIEADVVLEAPFPNPGRDQIRIKLIAPETGSATLSLFNSAGKIELSTTENVVSGLNNFFLNLRTLKTGVYFIRFEFNETISVQRIIKL